MIRGRFRFLALASAALLSGCISHEPRVALPLRTEANCESRSVKQTAIDSIVASTDDTVRPGRYPGDAALRATIRRTGGTFAWWPSQPMRMPDTAKALGVPGPYLDMVRVVITNEIDTGDHSRPIWMTFKTARGERTVLERAYDIQNVCIEGERQA